MTAWPDGIVPYTLDVSLKTEERVLDVIDMIEERTSITFVPATIEDDGLHIAEWDRSYSEASIGYVPGAEHSIMLHSHTQKWVIYHEIFHSLGMRHEHTRPDRNEHIKVNWDNIDPDFQHDFYINDHHLYDIEEYPYETRSIMHYSSKTWALYGRSTETVNGDFIHHDYEPTELDWLKLNAIYSK